MTRERVNSDGRWPDVGDGEYHLDSEKCFICGFSFDDEPAVKEEELGVQGINGEMCYNCAVNSAGYWWNFYSIRGGGEFHLNVYRNTNWEGEYAPVVSSVPYDLLSESDQSLVEEIARQGVPDGFHEVELGELSEDLVYAIEPELAPGMKSGADSVPAYPRPLILTQGAVFTEAPSRVRDMLDGQTTSTENTDQAKLF